MSAIIRTARRAGRLVLPLRRRQRIADFVKFAGFRYACPFCGGRFRQWRWYGSDLPVLREQDVQGAGLRRAECPRCRSLDRERLLFTYLEHESDLLRAGKEVLHIAPEPRLSARLAQAPLKRYVRGDKFEPGYRYPEGTISLDVRALPFEDASFDAVLCNHVLEHIIDDDTAMRELHRVLRPSGFGLVLVPIGLALESTKEDASVTDPAEREQAFGQSDHVRIYEREDYAARLSHAGFRVEVLTATDASWRDAATAYGVNPREPIFVVRKAQADD